MKTAWFTICACNYLGYARTLYQSLRAHHPDDAFFVFVVDEPPRGSDDPQLEDLPFRHVFAHTLALPEFADMALRYDLMELATAIKPTCFKTLFEQYGFDHAVYLDPDIWVASPLVKVMQGLRDGASLILTPHILEAYTDELHPDARQILNVGTYNLGFAALSPTPESLQLLDWWQGQLLRGGHNDLAQGMFVDQKYIELAPSFVTNTLILRDRGYNAAYWNLHERAITRREGQWYAGPDALAFFHFSGVVPGRADIFSRHQNRFDTDNIGALKPLLAHYLQTLKGHHQDDYGALGYGYDSFAGGEPISPLMRKIYARTATHPVSAPASANGQSRYTPALFNQSDPDFPLPALVVEAWRGRNDLQKAFDIHHKQGRAALMQWFGANGADTFTLPPALVAALTSQSADAPRRAPTILARGAAKILNAAPTLRPLYQHIPVGLRGLVKTALYRTHHHDRASTDRLSMTPATASYDPALTPGVTLYGYVRSQSGIGQGARGLAKALKARSLPLAISALANPDDPREAHAYPEIASPGKGYRISLINANAEQVLRLEELVNPRRFDGTYRIAYWVWELAGFPPAFMPALDRVDEIWVPSQFVADALRAVTPKPVHVLPYAIVPETPAALTRQHFGLPDERTVFLTSFDVNSFIKRKNPGAVIDAFIAAFDCHSPNAPVLAIKVHGNKGNREARTVLESHIGGADNIVIIDQTLKRDEYLALHYQADIFVSLHRAEGFGLNIAEAMLVGKPVIATDWSGSRDFVTVQNAMPVACRLVDVPPGAYPHSEGQQWAEADHDEAVSAMQRLAFDRHARTRLGQAGQAFIRTRYSADAAGMAMGRRLGEIDPALAGS